MNRYIFKYTPEPTKTGIIHRPTARILLQSTKNEWYAFRVYIDSGADMSLFTRTDAKLLGLDLYKGEYRPIIGVGKTLIGTLILGILRNGLNLIGVTPYWQRVFIGALIIVTVVIDRVQHRREA